MPRSLRLYDLDVTVYQGNLRWRIKVRLERTVSLFSPYLEEKECRPPLQSPSSPKHTHPAGRPHKPHKAAQKLEERIRVKYYNNSKPLPSRTALCPTHITMWHHALSLKCPIVFAQHRLRLPRLAPTFGSGTRYAKDTRKAATTHTFRTPRALRVPGLARPPASSRPRTPAQDTEIPDQLPA